MKLRIKDVIAIVIIAILGYVLVIQKREIIRQETFLIAQEVTTEVWVDKYNQSNAKAERIEGDNKTINELYKMQTDSIETLSKQLKGKEVLSYQRVDAEITNHIVADTTMVGDTVVVNYQDKYITITGKLHNSFELDIKQFVPIHLMTYKERSGFFRKTSYVHAVSTNPNVTFTGVSSLAVKEKLKRYGIGVQVGVTYLNNGFRPYLGLGISYNFIRF